MARARLFHKFRSTALFDTFRPATTENLAGKDLAGSDQTLKDKNGVCQTLPNFKIVGKRDLGTRRERGNINLDREPGALFAPAATQYSSTRGRPLSDQKTVSFVPFSFFRLKSLRHLEKRLT